MANEQIKQNYRDIADAIRSKTGENGTMTPEEMPSKIGNDLAKKPAGSLNITANGNNIDVTTKATVNVSVPTYPEPSGTTYIYDNGYHNVYGYAEAYVDVSSGGGEYTEQWEKLITLTYSTDGGAHVSIGSRTSTGDVWVTGDDDYYIVFQDPDDGDVRLLDDCYRDSDIHITLPFTKDVLDELFGSYNIQTDSTLFAFIKSDIDNFDASYFSGTLYIQDLNGENLYNVSISSCIRNGGGS